MKAIAGLILLLMSSIGIAHGAAYVGGSYGLSTFTSQELADHKVTPKGNSYSGFLGIGKDFLGLEGFYTVLDASGKIKHENVEHDIKTNAKAYGAAMRLSFKMLYFRMGLAHYNLDQSIDMPAGSSHQAADSIYNVTKKNASKNGYLYGLGLYKKIGSVKFFVDYSRYQISQVGHYDTLAGGLALSLSDSWLPSFATDKD